jgi:ABC-type sugar transport system substrate-binding protein
MSFWREIIFVFWIQVILGLFSPEAEANEIISSTSDVIIFVNADDTFPFWQSEIGFAQAVADALNIKLTPHYIPSKYRDRFGVVTYINRHLKQLKQPPNLVMSAFFLGAEDKLLKLLDKHRIPFISLNSFISEKQYQILGRPREKFPLWLGHFSPNDIVVGEQLATALLTLYRKEHHCDKSVCGPNVFGFTGLPYAAVSQQRVKGVEEAIRQDRKSRMLNNVAANWRRSIALEKMKIVVHRHTDIDIFWAASDNMAWGVVDGIKKYQYKNKTLLGSIDWSPQTIPYIKNGDIDISLGGHFLEAGLALLLYYDYMHGKDFVKAHGTIIQSKMSELNKSNVDILGPFLINPKWNLNVLAGYSKHNNPSIENYEFDPLKIISQQLN